MTHDPFDTERRLQAAAEQPAAQTHDATEARYRYVLHAIRSLPVPVPPAGFARQIEGCVQDYPEDAVAEQWLLRIASLAALLLVLITAGPWLGSALQLLTASDGNVPWRFLGAILGGLAGFSLLDKLLSRPKGASAI